ncbi:MAG: electron transfer flavoprotein subunit alpha/FixB family protein [Bacteroidia bacterium]|nr:electron transfer flavoprotein subunit alpha/FixB family protein [Bacteroidia bacterium]
MPVLLFAEHSDGQFKKPALEAATYGYDLAQQMGTELIAVSVGMVSDEALNKLGEYGVRKVYAVRNQDFNSFVNAAYAAATVRVAQQTQSSVVVCSQTYNGRAVAARVAARLDAAALPGVISLSDASNHFDARRLAYSGKGVQELQAVREKLVIVVKTNGYKVEANPGPIEIAESSFEADRMDLGVVARELVKASEGISLTEAETVVSAGRGMKGPENWGMIEELAGLLGAATACSKPTADMGWRPHHEHVGQTGIQIAPNLYIAIGISGAIQHLAGVSSSKHIVVINKDPEAPFFKIADYGIVGDLFEVVPKLIAEIRSVKAGA